MATSVSYNVEFISYLFDRQSMNSPSLQHSYNHFPEFLRRVTRKRNLKVINRTFRFFLFVELQRKSTLEYPKDDHT